MNIAFVHDSFPLGGAERVTIDIARYLKSIDKGYNIYVYCKQRMAELLRDDINGIITIREFKCATNKEKSLKVEQLIREDGIDVLVQVVHRIYDIQGIKERTGVKVVMGNHGVPFWQSYNYIARKQRRWPLLWKIYFRFIYETFGRAMRKAESTTLDDYNFSDAYVVLCDGYRKEICNRLKINESDSHIVVIGNSETTVSDVCYDKEKLILYCGRLYNPTKRVDRLLRIWKRVQDDMKDWRLVLIGDGPHQKELEKMICSEGIERVSMPGWIRDVDQYYRKASIVCLTSQTESWGLVLTEAQVNGAIPVAFGCSEGVKHILTPSGVNGFIIPPYDEEKYAETLKHIAQMSEEEQMRIRHNVVNKGKEYSIEKVGKLWDDLFTGLMKS